MFEIGTSGDELDLPYIFLIPKMHKIPYKHRLLAGSSKCFTKYLSILFTKLLTHIKAELIHFKELQLPKICRWTEIVSMDSNNPRSPLETSYR